jgi:glycerophosphoryl diester phosphodiesterase
MVEGVEGVIDQMHLHACMLKQLFGLGVPEPIDMDEPNVEIRLPVQLGPRPYFLLNDMKDSKLKTDLTECAEEKKLFALSDFAIGHRGAPLQFPEHTQPSYEAAAMMGAGLVECDITFTSDLELVCRHAQCDLHTTTDVVTRPELNAKCTTPWSPGVTPQCCTSDFTLEEIKTLCAKMDSSGDVNSEDALGYAYGGTADFRTDLYQTSCPKVLTHKESIAVIHAKGAKFIPEAKAPMVPMPFRNFTQQDYAAKVVQEYLDMGVDPEDVWLQSNTVADIEYWVTTPFGAQALMLDFDDDRVVDDDAEYLDQVASTGVQFFGPPMWKLVAPNPEAGKDIYTSDMIPSTFAEQIKARNMTIIPWTLDRTGSPLDKPVSTDYYWQTLQGQGLNLTEGSRFDLLDVLYKDVGIAAIFDDWPAVSAFYANCMDISLRLF